MATKEEWVRHFEDVNGRKPSPEEFMEAKKEGFVIASEVPTDQVSEQVEAQRVGSSEATEEVSADSVADTQSDEAPKQMPALNLEKEQEKETPKTSQIPLENPYYKPKVTKNNAFVNIALPIIILVLGILFVILSWTLPIGFVFTFLAFFLIILAIVTLVLSLKSTRKALSIIALVMSIIFFMTSLAGAGYQAVKYVMNHAESEEFYQHLLGLIEPILPGYQKEGKSILTIAVGCTGGQHRSVAFAQRLADDLAKNWPVNASHRDKNRRKETVNRS